MKKLILLLLSCFIFTSVYAEKLNNSNAEPINTLEDGVLTIAVTGVCKDESPHHNCWVYKVFSTFAEKNNLTLKLQVVPFDKSWLLADQNQVDVVATGITPLPERVLGKAKYSDTYSIVKRGIRIKRANADKYHTMADFKGQSIAAVKGMTSEKDLRNRAVPGVAIVTPMTWEEVYDLFNSDKVAGIAEGFYVFPEDQDDINADENTVLVDVHDLEPGSIEGNRFVVREASTNLLIRLNEHIKSLGLPNHRP